MDSRLSCIATALGTLGGDLIERTLYFALLIRA